MNICKGDAPQPDIAYTPKVPLSKATWPTFGGIRCTSQHNGKGWLFWLNESIIYSTSLLLACSVFDRTELKTSCPVYAAGCGNGSKLVNHAASLPQGHCYGMPYENDLCLEELLSAIVKNSW